MVMKTISDTEAVAAEWLAMMISTDISPEQSAYFQSWLDADPRHRVAFLRFWTLWGRCDCLKTLQPPDGKVDPDLLLNVVFEEGPKEI
jgi:ferric-dicitrate binding protein FerR (iron transport regulator)